MPASLTRRACAAALLAGLAAPARAHHSFAMYDRGREMMLKGMIREVQWHNPHVFIQLVVKDKRGKTVEWSLEGGSPGILERNGWKYNSLQGGEEVSMLIYPLKSGKAGGSFLEITKADGTKLYYHG